MGRYVEQEFPLPEGMAVRDLVMLSTGQLRVAAKDEDGNTYIVTTGADRTAWEETEKLPPEILNAGRLESIALAPDGTVFCDTILKDEETGDCSFRYWVLDPEGACRELMIDYPELDPQAGYLIGTCDFTDDGRLFANFGVLDVREVDLQTGSLSEKRNDLLHVVMEVRCGGQDTYFLGYDECSVLHEGTDAALTGVLEETVMASLQYTMGMDPKVTFCENGDGYLFFTTHEGLYSYIPGGSVVEQLVSGARTTLGDPTFTPKAMTVAEDQSFFVLGSGSEGDMVYHYVYDPDMPTVPSNQLRVYSLYDDEDLRQMISRYQKSHPDVAIELEVGLTGEDGITEADAIRTLNTEILAGDGPDILELDGFSLDTYLKKNMLADLSGMLDQAGPLLDQVARCYESDGKVCALPTTFAIPAIYGPGHIVSQIHDLDSLVAASTQAKEENPQQRSVFSGWIPVLLLDQFYDSCSAAWMKEDGTLDEGKLTEFFTAMEALYALDSEMREEMAEALAQMKAEGGIGYTPGAYTGMGGAIHVLTGGMVMTPGTIDGMLSWAHDLGGDDRLEGYETAPMGLQASNVFLPRRIMGVLNTSENREYAADFLWFMLSEEIQYNCLSTGFPVSRAAFDRLINEEQELDWSASTSDGEGNHVSVEIHYPDAEHRQQLKGWVESLTTPAMTNRIIRSMVIDEASACLDGEKTVEEAVQAALAALNLYLSE